jgi:ATP-dependent RNA helicase HelY
MPTPAERYAAARARSQFERSEVSAFVSTYAFPLDDFQLAACQSLEAGHDILVAAPTGAGKTVVGEFAAHLALRDGRKCFYTTPIKALSNQKFAEFVQRYGAESVGLLTGDTSINSEASIVVMTTEVLRNMIYAGSSTLKELGYVVLDEVHYLADRFRGAVWEEVLIHLPKSVRTISLSATVSNAEEFGEWLQSIRGEVEIIVSEHRPVPLFQHVILGHRLFDLFSEESQREVNRDLIRVARDAQRAVAHSPRRRGENDVFTPSRAEVIAALEAENLLPAITFIFSRAGCESAVHQCLASGLRLTSKDEREIIRRIVLERTAQLPEEDLYVLGFHEWLDGLERGVAAHHAGLIPTFKEVVETLFQMGLVKAVFATETLALGINMPARSVVLERLVKWNGEAHVDITPGEYTQLTGRAGRRGIDIEGHAVAVWSQNLDPTYLASLASTRTYPLKSSFSPTYNMAINMVERLGYQKARDSLESSFAQFQADRSVSGLLRQVNKHQEAIEGYGKSMTCHLGDFAEYAKIRRDIKNREQELTKAGSRSRNAAIAASLEELHRGDVIMVSAGRRSGLAVVLDPGIGVGFDGLRPTVLAADRRVVRLTVVDFSETVSALGRLRIPAHFDARSPKSRRELATHLMNSDFVQAKREKVRSSAADDSILLELRAALRHHPCHGCDEREDHARWAERLDRLKRETKQLDDQIQNRTHVIARTFERICAVLTELGYLLDSQATHTGRLLGSIYTELDLLTAECIQQGVWEGLTSPELAGVVSLLIHESRGDDRLAIKTPSGRSQDAMAAMVAIWSNLTAIEHSHRLTEAREPDPAFSWAAYRWASGHRLESVLRDSDLTAGDFVRNCKQLIDLLGQIATVTNDSALRTCALAARKSIFRGVVATASESVAEAI